MPRPARHGLLAALLLAGLTATRSASASDTAACREFERAFDLVKLDISSVQLNAILFSTAGKGCEPWGNAGGPDRRAHALATA